MKKALLFLSVRSFPLFLSTLAVKNFKSKHLLVHKALFAFACFFSFFFQPLPFPLFQFTSWHAAFRDAEGISFSQFNPFFQVLPDLLQIAFHNDVVLFEEPT